MPYDGTRQKARRQAAKEVVDQLRAETVCVECGEQPIDWHNPEHDQDPNRRIGRMVSAPYAVAAILEEIARCTPLCRRCHMREDGRDQLLGNQLRGKTYTVPLCTECKRPAKPSRRGLCGRCYLRKWTKGEI